MRKLGPVRYFWGPKKRFLSAWLKTCQNDSWGWEWGLDGLEHKPIVSLRLFGLQIIYFERFQRGGYEAVCFGFWRIK